MPFFALLGRQIAAGKRDHHRVITRQQHVYHDDFQHIYPEWGSHKHF